MENHNNFFVFKFEVIVPREDGLALLGGLLPNQVPQPPPPPPVEEEQAPPPLEEEEQADVPDYVNDRLQALISKGNTLSNQFSEQDIKDLVLLYIQDRRSFDEIFPRLALGKKPAKNVMQKIEFRADPVKKAKHNIAVRNSQQKMKERRSAQAQQNM